MSKLRTVVKRVDYDLAGLLRHIDFGDIGRAESSGPSCGPLPGCEMFEVSQSAWNIS
jgi:hypothetical protein